MTEQLLYLSDVGPAFQQMRGAGVPQRVRRDVLAKARAPGCLAHNAHDIVVIKWPTRNGSIQTNAPDRLHVRTGRALLRDKVSRRQSRFA